MLNLKYGQSLTVFSDMMSGAGKVALVFCSMAILMPQVHAVEGPELAVPDGAKVVIVGEDLNINGLPTRVWELSSSQSPEEILAYYRQEWQDPAESKGPGFLENEAGGWQIISRSDEPYFYTVQVREAAMGSSFGFLAVSRPMDLVNHKPDGFAKPAGSEILLDLASDDAGKRGRVVQFKNQQTVEANYHFYRELYMAQGWKELSQLSADRDTALLLMNKGNGEISIVFNRIDNESYGVLVESYD
ncbi:hypothetical protein SAMN05216203_1937 [Marinobacter daqiaonensis]|uniref:Uncharacterized protein n=1 Tax=Marinobacter daqiaonensis TaxID=650891 RepID=A0A1I6I8N8_9GAMM|nr:hypothetical protein [Marinobacter daqiaonensis]SFR62760.1 hypothetical protein SAMN05216203_1937 [Marinobacter daqiaonensis]